MFLRNAINSWTRFGLFSVVAGSDWPKPCGNWKKGAGSPARGEVPGAHRDVFREHETERDARVSAAESQRRVEGIRHSRKVSVKRFSVPTVRTNWSVFRCKFSNTSIHVQFTLNPSGQVAGMYFRPPNKPLPYTWKRPSYSKPESFHEREVTVGSDMWKLGGTLTIPVAKARCRESFWCTARDPMIVTSRFSRSVCSRISPKVWLHKGYAVLRYDKRTKVYGEEMSESSYTIDDETVEDATRAIALLRKQPEIDPNRIYVLGHSLGGYASPRIAARDRKLAGLIVMAGPARPVEDVAFDQTDYVLHLKGEPGAG